MAAKGGVDSKPIGGFQAAMANYTTTATKANDGGKGKAAGKAGKASSGGAGGGDGGQNALFASINSGQPLTKGLNKVTSDMKTKNRKDRSGKVPAGQGGKKVADKAGKAKYEKKEADKDPEIKKMGATIRVSYFKNMEKLMIFGSAANDPDEKKDDPYTPENMKTYDGNAIDMKKQIEIWDCTHGMFRVSKKCKAIKLYNCKKVQLSVKSVVSTIEVTNCNGCTVFVKEKAPSLLLEKCDGCKVWLDETAAASDPPPQLFTTLTQNTELNVSQGGDKDPLSVPVPSQFVTSLEGGKWKTQPVEHV